MKKIFFLLLAMGGLPTAGRSQSPVWTTLPDPLFTLHYTATDSITANALAPVLRKGVRQVEAFFSHPFLRPFDVYIFPDRPALDRQWQQDWGDSTFHSSCWMVASGTGRRLDVLSPRVWDVAACEHQATDRVGLQQLLTHEIVHVYHGQHNPTTDFTGMDDLAWWVEGLATFASGQLDSTRIRGVQGLLDSGQAPDDLQQFWTGRHRYGLAGSAVAWVEVAYGRQTLFDLLPLIQQDAIFGRLQTDEGSFLQQWKQYWQKK